MENMDDHGGSLSKEDRNNVIMEEAIGLKRENIKGNLKPESSSQGNVSMIIDNTQLNKLGNDREKELQKEVENCIKMNEKEISHRTYQITSENHVEEQGNTQNGQSGSEENCIKNSEGNYGCSVCWKACKNDSSLSRHMRDHNPNFTRFHCDKCGGTFIHLEYLKKHEHSCNDKTLDLNSSEMMTMRSNQIMYSDSDQTGLCCDMCGETFTRPSGLDRHRQMCQGKKHDMEAQENDETEESMDEHKVTDSEDSTYEQETSEADDTDEDEVDKHALSSPGSQKDDDLSFQRNHECFTSQLNTDQSADDRKINLRKEEVANCIEMIEKEVSHTTCQITSENPVEKQGNAQNWQSGSRQSCIKNSEGNYECSVCGKTYKSGSSLSRHRRDHNPNFTGFHCDKCGGTFKRLEILKRHNRLCKDKERDLNSNEMMSIRSNQISYSDSDQTGLCCDMCGETFTRPAGLDRHKQMCQGKKHDMEEQENSETEESMDEHEVTDSEDSTYEQETSETDDTEEDTVDKYTLSNHGSQNDDDLSFQRNHASFTSQLNTDQSADDRKINLRKEVDNCIEMIEKEIIHTTCQITSENPVEEQGNAQNGQSGSRQNRIKNAEGNYECSVCGKTYKSASSLYRHRRDHNPNFTGFHCDKCGGTFKRLEYLKKHEPLCQEEQLDLHTNELMTSNELMTVRSNQVTVRSSKIIYSDSVQTGLCCDMCGETFTRPSGLDRHRQMCHGKKHGMEAQENDETEESMDEHEVTDSEDSTYEQETSETDDTEEDTVDKHTLSSHGSQNDDDLSFQRNHASFTSQINTDQPGGDRKINLRKEVDNCIEMIEKEIVKSKDQISRAHDVVLAEVNNSCQSGRAVSAERDNQENTRCAACQKSFRTASDLRRHMKLTLHNSCSGSFSCLQCKVSYDDIPLHKKSLGHLSRQQSLMRALYSCKICHRSYYSISSLRKHKAEAHKMSGSHVCNKCGKLFQTQKILEDHSLVHNYMERHNTPKKLMEQ